jgi:predicted deacylase
MEAGMARVEDSGTPRARIITDLDYDRPGRQEGVLRVPHSHDECGWGTVAIPVVVVANGKGPTVLLTGGTHGDEYEAPIALMDLARALKPEVVQGRVILIPSLHFPAAKAGRRLSPIDKRDLNRSFPGDPHGSFAYMLADYVTTRLLPITDVNLDLHSGGRGMDFVISTTGHVLDDPERMARTTALAKAFGAPYHVVIKEVDSSGTFMTACENRGIVAISSELGGGNRVSIPGVAATRQGVRNALVHLGVIEGRVEQGPQPTRVVTVPDYACYAFAPLSGLYCPQHTLGTPVRAGEPAGAIYDIDHPGRAPEPVTYGNDGELWCTRGQGRVDAGDPVAVVVAPYHA